MSNGRTIYRRCVAGYSRQTGRAWTEVSFPLTLIAEPMPPAFEIPGMKRGRLKGLWEGPVQEDGTYISIWISLGRKHHADGTLELIWDGVQSHVGSDGVKVLSRTELTPEFIRPYTELRSWESRWLYWEEDQEKPAFLTALEEGPSPWAKSYWPRISQGRVYIGYSIKRKYCRRFAAALHRVFQIARRDGVDLRLRQVPQ